MEEKDYLDKMRLELEKEYYSGQMKPDRYKTLVGSVNQRENDLDVEISVKNTELDTIKEKDKWLNWLDTHLNKIDGLKDITDIVERKKVIKDYINTIRLEWNKTTKQHTINISFKLPLVSDEISYKKGKSGQYLRDRKGFKKYDIIDGGKELKTPYLHQNSLNSYTFSKVSWLVNFAPSQNG